MTPGSLVYDRDQECVGVVMDAHGQSVYLRPVGGGVEWVADRARVRPATGAEVAAAGAGKLRPPAPVIPRLAVFVPPCPRPCSVCQEKGRQ